MTDMKSGLHIPTVDETLKTSCEGALSNGRKFETVESRRNGLEYEGQIYGGHFILQFKDGKNRKEGLDADHDALCLEARTIGRALSKHFTPTAFRTMVNEGPAARRPHYHIHIMCPDMKKIDEAGLELSDGNILRTKTSKNP